MLVDPTPTTRRIRPLAALALIAALLATGCREPTTPSRPSPAPTAPPPATEPAAKVEPPREPLVLDDPVDGRGRPPSFGIEPGAGPDGEGDPSEQVGEPTEPKPSTPGRAPIGGWRSLMVPELAFAAVADARRSLDRLLTLLARAPTSKALIDLAIEQTLSLRGQQLELDAATGRLRRALPPGPLRRALAEVRAGRPPSDALADCLEALDTAAPAPRPRALREGLYAALAPDEVAVFFQRYRVPGAGDVPPAPDPARCAFPPDPGAGTLALLVGKRADGSTWQAAVPLPGAADEHDRAACGLHEALGTRERWPTPLAEAVAAYALHPIVEVLKREAGSGCGPRDRPLRLAIAPDAELHRVPFYGLSVAPRGPLLIEGRCTARRVYGLRDFEPPSDPPGRGVVAAAQPLARGGAPVAMRGRQYGRLQHASNEARAVAARLCPTPSAGYCPPGATHRPLNDIDERGLRHVLATPPAVLHLAMHGDFEPATVGPDPRTALDAAWLVLGAPKGGDATADDQLVAREVGDELDLAGTGLAFLSACHSGRGAAERAEGLYGLPRAFHAAGAERVVASLWKVDDGRALAFSGRFYTVLARTGDAARALAEAARSAREQGSNDWAAFVLSGRGGLMRLPSETQAPTAPLPAACQIE